jgi:predicted transcriptional regulator
MLLTLSKAMKRADLNPEDLSAKSGVDRATVYRLIKGDITNPRTDTVRKLEAALDLRRGSLVFGAEAEELTAARAS